MMATMAQAVAEAGELPPEDVARIAQIDEAIARFTGVMREKMVKNIHKKEDWKEAPMGLLWGRAMLEIEELKLAMEYEGPVAAQKECADVSNFMMILFTRMFTEEYNVRTGSQNAIVR